MEKQELIDRFLQNHRALIVYVDAITEEQFTTNKEGKWSPAQQLKHVQLCLHPMTQALASKDYIKAKFGTTDHIVQTYGQIVEQYKAALDKGGKAPERFVPQSASMEDKAMLKHELEVQLQTIQELFSNYTDEEVDTLILPHPLLGNLSIRELFYLMTYHATHHLLQTQKNLKI